MPLVEFRAQSFRCLEDAELTLDPGYNLIHGVNASGKTSILEAMAYLGRGKSFRGAPPQSLIRHGASEFTLFGRLSGGGRERKLGVRNSRDGLEARVDGESVGAAALAEALPLQVIDPDVHNLVSAGPEERRRFLDWIAFHVEPGFLDVWRRFRRALKQRNAALRAGGSGIRAWDNEFVELGLLVDAARRSVLEVCVDTLEEYGSALLGEAVGFEYRPGWSADRPLAEALAESSERDRQQGSTQVGPHRADIRIALDERQARRLVSRGQQKLLACSMILAATELVQTHLERPMLLLVDDPAAELDVDSLARLLSLIFGLGSQLVTTALDPEALIFPREPAVFHVEQGTVSRA